MIPDDNQRYFHTLGQCWTEVLKALRNKGKALHWFATENPNIGCAPIMMIQLGREEKLLKIIKAMTEGDGP